MHKKRVRGLRLLIQAAIRLKKLNNEFRLELEEKLDWRETNPGSLLEIEYGCPVEEALDDLDTLMAQVDALEIPEQFLQEEITATL